MPVPTPLLLRTQTIQQLNIEDEASFRHVGLYGDLKQVLRRAAYPFRLLPQSLAGRWDRALLLNLTYWGSDGGGDVLVDENLPADVVTHAAWHHLAAQALAPSPGAQLSPMAMFLGESIASAFDVYLVGRLLGQAPESTFLETQVPAMAEVAEAAGLSTADFDRLLEGIAADPGRAFADLRQLLFDATLALCESSGTDAALTALGCLDGHRFAPLLHRYELSNWVLFARAYGQQQAAPDLRAQAIDQALRQAADPLDWLTREWVLPALAIKAT
jgi:hypothetical protein